MKNLIALFALLSVLAFQMPAYAGGEMKEVCSDVTDKAGKTKSVCKKVKVHKKVEGDKVPDGKKK
jgi:hypothetical protein